MQEDPQIPFSFSLLQFLGCNPHSCPRQSSAYQCVPGGLALYLHVVCATLVALVQMGDRAIFQAAITKRIAVDAGLAAGKQRPQCAMVRIITFLILLDETSVDAFLYLSLNLIGLLLGRRIGTASHPHTLKLSEPNEETRATKEQCPCGGGFQLEG